MGLMGQKSAFLQSNKGQVTVFIILGIILLAVSSLAFFLINNYGQIEDQTTGSVADLSSTDSVQLFVEQCLEDAAYSSTSSLLAKGGYSHLEGVDLLSENYLDFGQGDEFFTLPYYFAGGESTMPEIEEMKTSLETLIVKDFLLCVDNFSAFEKQGYSVESADPLVDVSFVDGGYFVNLDYPFMLNTMSMSSESASFRSYISFDFLEVYSQIEEFLLTQEEDPKYFSIGALSSVLRGSGYYYEYIPFGEQQNEILVQVYYPVPVQEEDFVLSFVLLYDWDELHAEQEHNSSQEPGLIMSEMEDWHIVFPGVHTYQVSAEGEGISYEVSPNTLDVDPSTGLITLDSSEYSNGVYLYFIKVSDIYNKSTQAPLLINLNVNDGSLAVLRPFTHNSFTVGDTVELTLSVENPEQGPYTYSAETSLFDINSESGEFDFVPTKYDLGPHQIYFTVENEHGLTWLVWDFEVVE